jgi:hypothetical protein
MNHRSLFGLAPETAMFASTASGDLAMIVQVFYTLISRLKRRV